MNISHTFKAVSLSALVLGGLSMPLWLSAAANSAETQAQPLEFAAYPGSAFLASGTNLNLTYTLQNNTGKTLPAEVVSVTSTNPAVSVSVSNIQTGQGFCTTEISEGELKFLVPALSQCNMNILAIANTVGFADAINLTINYGASYDLVNNNDTTNVTVFSTDWISDLGPPGGTANQIIASLDGNTLYAAAANGIYKSTDNGENWTQLNNGAPITTFINNSVAIDPANPNILFTGTNGAGVYKSTDGGNTWNSANTGLPAGTIINNIVAGTIGANTRLLVGTNVNTIYYSNDGGSTWTAATVPILVGSNCATSSCSIELLFNPANNNDVYAGFFNNANTGNGVYQSADGGITWAATGTPADTANLAVISLGINSTSTTVYAGTYANNLYQSPTNTIAWTQFPVTGLSNPRISAITTTGNQIYVGTRNDGVRQFDGTAWNNFTGTVADNSALAPNQQMVSLLAVGTNLYAGNIGGGIFFTTTSSTAWQLASGFDASSIQSSLAVGPDRTLYAGSDGAGVFRLSGISVWLALNNGLTTTSSLGPRAIAVTPDNKNLYMATNGGGMFKANNNSNPDLVTWTAVPTNPSVNNGRSMAIAPNGNVYAGTGNSSAGGVYYYNGNSFILGSYCSSGNPVQVYTRSMAASSTNIVYVATQNLTGVSPQNGGVLRLDPNNNCWETTGNLGALTLSYLRAVAVAPNGTVYTSGATGDEVPPGFVFFSTDNGNTWTEIDSGLPNATDLVYALAVAPNGDVYAGTGSNGVYRLPVGTTTWVAFNTHLPFLEIRSLAVISAGANGGNDYVVFAGTNGSGVYSRYVSP